MKFINYLKKRKIFCQVVILIVSLILLILLSLIKEKIEIGKLFIVIINLITDFALVGLIICECWIIFRVSFNGKEKFNKDSFFICSFYIVPLIMLILIFLSNVGNVNNQLMDLPFEISSSFLASSICFAVALFFWIVYLKRCKKVIIEIKEDWHLFLIKIIKSIISETLLFFSGIICISSFTCEGDISRLFFQPIYIFFNLMFPFIEMYTYVRLKIDEFDKQEQEKREKLEQQKREELEKLEQQKREELEKLEQQKKEKYKYDLYNYD